MSKKYRLKFYGRKIGALGVSGVHEVVVEADSPEEARMKAYDTHEHIRGGSDGVYCEEVGDGPPDQ